jgi:hypothetical protein
LHRFPSDVRGDEPINDGFVIKHAANALGLTRGRTATLLKADQILPGPIVFRRHR